MKRITSLLSVFALFVAFTACAQHQKPSPPASAEFKVGGANIKIKYSAPSVKGREIWGKLVPYGEVWRTGANEATTFETDKDIKVEGKTLPAGTYSLFTIPGKDEWYLVYHRFNYPNGINMGPAAGYNREVCIDKMEFNTAGTIKQVQPTHKGIPPVNGTESTVS